MLTKPKTRWRATGIHLILSLLIFALLAAVIVFIWYPSFLFTTDGGWQGIRLIAGVDLILGPLLTLMVYDVTKKNLKWDLLAIGIVQFSALTAGCWIVYQERPVLVSYADQSFQTASAGVLEVFKLEQSDYSAQFKETPAWVYVELSDDDEQRKDAIRSQGALGPLHFQIDRFTAYEPNIKRLLEESISPKTLETEYPDLATSTNALFRLNARYYTGLIELDKDTGEFIQLYRSKNKALDAERKKIESVF